MVEMKKETTKGVELTEVVTGTAQAFKLPNDETVDVNSYLVWLGNQVLDIKKAVA